VDATFESRAEGARALGMTPQGLNDYLKGRRAPGADILARMAEKGLDVGWYLTGTPTTGHVDTSPPAVAEPPPHIWKRADLDRVGAYPLAPDDLDIPLVETPEEMALLFYERIIKAQERAQEQARDEIKRELERVVAAIARQ
jgi:transcriptional regulator with XRE-family HTH domain